MSPPPLWTFTARYCGYGRSAWATVRPARCTFAAVTARSYHSGGVNVLVADGSIHFIADSIALSTWRALGTMNGGETIGDY